MQQRTVFKSIIRGGHFFMKIFKVLWPVIINILSTILYFPFAAFLLMNWLGPDWVFLQSLRRNSYHFSRGSISVSFIIWLFLATVLYVVRMGKKHPTLGKRIVYYMCTIGIVGVVDWCWLNYYYHLFFLWSCC